MKYQVDLLEPHINAAPLALSKIADLKICKITVVEIDDDNPAAPILAALLGSFPAVVIPSIPAPSAPFLEPEPEKVEKAPAGHATIANSCANCGMVFDARRRDQRYCSKPECQKAKNKQYQAAWLSKKAGGNGDQPETQAAEATPGPLDQS